LTNVEGVQAARDIVQFVPFSKYKDRPIELAKETLKEVPKQVIFPIGFSPHLSSFWNI